MLASRLPLFPLVCLLGIGCASEPLEAGADALSDAADARCQEDWLEGWRLRVEGGVSPDSPVVLLDSRQGATLSGRLEAPIPHTDADRVLRLEATGPLDALSGERILDARFVDGGVVVLDVDHTLYFQDDTGTSIALDGDVYGPLTVAGAYVAYVHGGPPDLELARADVRTGVVERLTTAMAPVWSPALSEDGREVIFVSGVEGAPRLYRVNAQGVVMALATSPRTPSSPTPPVWRGTTLIFEDEAGTAQVEVAP